MKGLPVISVIVPIYNVEDYIADCLKSVLSQTYSNIEILCVDDCGSDTSMEIVERFSCMPGAERVALHSQHVEGLRPYGSVDQYESSCKG